MLAGRASLLLAEATWGEKAADVSVDYLAYNQSAEGASVSCEPFDSAAVAVLSKSGRSECVSDSADNCRFDTLAAVASAVSAVPAVSVEGRSLGDNPSCPLIPHPTPIPLCFTPASPPSGYQREGHRRYGSRGSRRRDDGLI